VSAELLELASRVAREAGAQLLEAFAGPAIEVESKSPVARFLPFEIRPFREGLVMRAVGDRMIVAPPLVVTRAQLDEMMELVRRCLDLTLADAQAAGWLA